MIRKIAMLGAGHFGEVMLNVMATPEERARGIEVIATHRRAERRAELKAKFGIPVLADNREACRDADMIYPLARPNQMEALMKEIGPVVQDHQILATGASSLRLSFYRQYLPSKCALAWVFPTPFMRTHSGYLAICHEPGIDPGKLFDLKEYWSRFCDDVLIIAEEAMDAFTILHACSQMYLYPVIQAMIAFGRGHGLTREQAQALVLSTFKCTATQLGKAQDAEAVMNHFLANLVVPDSMTGVGLRILGEKKVEEIYSQALMAAQCRGEEMQRGL